MTANPTRWATRSRLPMAATPAHATKMARWSAPWSIVNALPANTTENPTRWVTRSRLPMAATPAHATKMARWSAPWSIVNYPESHRKWCPPGLPCFLSALAATGPANPPPSLLPNVFSCLSTATGRSVRASFPPRQPRAKAKACHESFGGQFVRFHCQSR